MAKKLVPLWTARLSADNLPQFTPHQGLAPSKPQVSFKLRLDKHNRPIKEEPNPLKLGPVAIEIKHLPKRHKEKMVDNVAIAKANGKHDEEHKGELMLPQRFYNGGPDRPSRSTRTATDKNRAKDA